MRIRYVGIDGGLTRLTLDEFLQFSPKVRAVLICEGLVSFYGRRGRPMPTRQALVELASTWGEAEDDAFGRAMTNPYREQEKAADPGAERRRHERHSMVVPVSVESEAGSSIAFTENISEGGMLFRSARPFHTGERVRLVIPEAGETDCIVIRSRRADAECFTAVAFIDKLAAAA